MVQVTDAAVVATSMNFEFAASYTDSKQLAKAGIVIGWQDGEPIRTPYDNRILVMPSCDTCGLGQPWHGSDGCSIERGGARWSA